MTKVVTYMGEEITITCPPDHPDELDVGDVILSIYSDDFYIEEVIAFDLKELELKTILSNTSDGGSIDTIYFNEIKDDIYLVDYKQMLNGNKHFQMIEVMSELNDRP